MNTTPKAIAPHVCGDVSETHADQALLTVGAIAAMVADMKRAASGYDLPAGVSAKIGGTALVVSGLAPEVVALIAAKADGNDRPAWGPWSDGFATSSVLVTIENQRVLLISEPVRGRVVTEFVRKDGEA